MKTITKILKFLEIPDDQGKNWYAWAANQLSHAMIGAIFSGTVLMICGSVSWAIIIALGLAVIKELFDISKEPKSWKDSLDDISFQLAGLEFCVAVYCSYGYLFIWSIFYGALLLWIGIYNRIK